MSKKSRKRIIDLEEGELSDANECELSEFSDGYGEDLKGDEADRAHLASLNELDREYELYQRSLKRAELRNEWNIKCQLAKGKVTDAALKERCKARRTNLESQLDREKRSVAFEQLVAMRSRKKQLSTDSDDQATPKHKKKKDHRAQQALLGLSPSNKYQVKKVKLKAADVYSDDSGDSDEEQQPAPALKDAASATISTRSELSKALLTRNQLESFLDKPIFKQTVANCFVRISMCGRAPSVYGICQILAVESSRKNYKLGAKCTNLALRLQHGSAQFLLHMDIVSNQPATREEFNHWRMACQRECAPMPSVAQMEQKKQDIELASNYAFTEHDVEQIVQSKRSAGQHRTSAAYRKVCLFMERDKALASDNIEQVNKLNAQIQDIDKQTRNDHLQRVKSTSCRLPQVNSAKPKRTISTPTPKWSAMELELEPQMRRKHSQATRPKPMRESAASSEDSDNSEIKDILTVQASAVPQINLFDLHNFEVELDVSALPTMSDIFNESKLSNMSRPIEDE